MAPTLRKRRVCGSYRSALAYRPVKSRLSDPPTTSAAPPPSGTAACLYRFVVIAGPRRTGPSARRRPRCRPSARRPAIRRRSRRGRRESEGGMADARSLKARPARNRPVAGSKSSVSAPRASRSQPSTAQPPPISTSPERRSVAECAARGADIDDTGTTALGVVPTARTRTAATLTHRASSPTADPAFRAPSLRPRGRARRRAARPRRSAARRSRRALPLPPAPARASRGRPAAWRNGSR
jgi:hypothetical protein